MCALVFTLPLACSRTIPATNPDDGGACQTSAQCAPGQACVYPAPGCNAGGRCVLARDVTAPPAPICTCSGHTELGGAYGPTLPWAHSGECRAPGADAGALDASPLDADRVDTGHDDAEVDASRAVVGWAVRVVLGPQRPLRPGAGFAVRVEDATGVVVEGMTDADGVAPLPVAPSAGPWDITVARAGCTAVSILGVDGPFDGEIYAECGPSPHDQERHHTLTLGVAGVSALSTGPGFCPGGYLQADRPDRVRVDFWYRADAPPIDVWALQFETMNPRARPLNVARLAPLALLDREIDAVLTLPATPVAVVSATITVQFPTHGLLTGASAARSAGYDAVVRWLTGVEGALVPCRVGRGTWTPPDAGSVGTWQFETFAPPFAPDVATLPLGVNDPDAVIEGSFAARTFADGARITLAPVSAVAVDARAVDDVRLTADAPGYDAVSFHASPDVPHVYGAWRGYTARGATLGARRLPRLPSSVSLTDLTYGLAQTNRFRVSACVSARRPGARPPWTPDAELDADVVVCARRTAALSDP